METLLLTAMVFLVADGLLFGFPLGGGLGEADEAREPFHPAEILVSAWTAHAQSSLRLQSLCVPLVPRRTAACGSFVADGATKLSTQLFSRHKALSRTFFS